MMSLQKLRILNNNNNKIFKKIHYIMLLELEYYFNNY